ncbi:hypothetical protein QEN19_004138 [Hanseniaspora menglaensis]
MENSTSAAFALQSSAHNNQEIWSKNNFAQKSNEYKLITKIGHGAYGTVYKAQQLLTKKFVAIKIVEVEEDEFIDDYMTEIDLLQNLSHKNIVKCLGFEKRQNNEKKITSRFSQQPYCKLFIFLEFCSKGSLRDLMSDKTICPQNYIPENMCRNFIHQTLQGLKYLHDQGIIHRDIKCGNLLLTGKEDIIKLADFGISTQVSHTLKSNTKGANAGVAMTCIGSPNWMAPEILLGQGATTKSDIWSLGSTLVEMLTGQPPFYNLNNREAVCYAIVHDFFIFNKKDRERLTSNCLIFVAYLFNKNIFQRPSAKDLLDGKFIDSMKNSNWLFEEEIDLKMKNAKLLKFKELEEGNKLTMFDEDFLIDESLLKSTTGLDNNESNPDLTVSSLNIQNSPFKPKNIVKDTNVVGNEKIRDEFGSIGRSEMILEQFSTININSLKILRLIQDIDSQELNKFIINKLLIAESSFITDSNLLTYFKVAWGNTDNLGIELATKIQMANAKFSKLNGSASVIMHLKNLVTSRSDENKLLLKNWIYVLNQSKWKDTVYTSPLTINLAQHLVKDFSCAEKKLDIVIWEFILKLSYNIVSKFGAFYISQFNCLIDNLLAIDRFRNGQDLEMFQVLFLKLTELGLKMDYKQILCLTIMSNKKDIKWKYFVVKVFNNILKSINEKISVASFDKGQELDYADNKDAFHFSDKLKSWLFEDITLDISRFDFTTLLELKYCRYFFELVYNLCKYQPSIRLVLINDPQIIKICQKLTTTKLNSKSLDSAVIRYHRYDLKLVIRLVSDLSIEFNNPDLKLALSVYKEYAYASLVYLQQHITYSVYAIDILSNCAHKLLKTGEINFTDFKSICLHFSENQNIIIDLRLLLNGFIEMNLLQRASIDPIKMQEEAKHTDFDLVFKSVHKLLSSLTLAAKESDGEDKGDEDYSTIITENSFSSDSDKKFSLKYQYSPLSLFIVDNSNFTNIVLRIFEKYKGTLILQIDFLKFLKLLFKQYVGFRVEYYLNRHRGEPDTEGKSKKIMSYSILNSSGSEDLLPKRTANFKDVRDYLLRLWEDLPDKGHAKNASSHSSSVASSPKKLGTIETLDSKNPFILKKGPSSKDQPRVGHNSIIIKTLVRDIDLIYRESITLA